MYRGEFDIGAEKKLSLNIEDTRCKWLGIFSVNLMVFMKLFAAAHLRGTFRPWLRFPFLRRMQCFSCFPMWVALASQFAYKHWHKDLFGCTILRINYTLHMTRYRYRVFFKWSARFSVPKWKTSCSQPGLIFREIFNLIKLLVGWASFFILVLKIGRTS